MANKLTKEIIKEDVLKIINEYDCTKFKTYKKNGKYCESTIIKYFENWNNLLNEMNIEPAHKKNINLIRLKYNDSKKDVLNKIRNFKKQIAQ